MAVLQIHRYWLDIINNIECDNWYDILKIIISKIVGVYCLIIGVKDNIYALRDSYGVRPLCFCKNKTGSMCIISESNLLEEEGYTLLRI